MNDPSKKTVLIIEDDHFLSSMYAEKLSLEGFQVLTALDGRAGLTSALSASPDLIILDILMPEMDGLTVLKHLRADVATAHVPVIMLTNLSQSDQIDRAHELGANEYLVKAHFIPSEVVAKVRQLIN